MKQNRRKHSPSFKARVALEQNGMVTLSFSSAFPTKRKNHSFGRPTKL